MNLTRCRAGAFALALILLPGLALAQSTPLYQSGTMTKAHDIPKLTRNGQVQDAAQNGTKGDANGLGVNPFGITDKTGDGACSNTAATGGPYDSVCIGHDPTTGNALISVDSFGGSIAKSFAIRINGVYQSILGLVTGHPQAATNVALKAIPASTYPFITRMAFLTAGDAPATPYYSSASSCVANGLVDDNGKCSGAVDGGSWIANFKGMKPSPKIWGCKGDGTTDDSVCFQAAVTAMGAATGKLYVGPGEIYKLNTGIASAAQGLELVCENRWTTGGGGTASGLRAGTLNMSLLTLSGFNQKVEDCYLDMSGNGAFANTAGAAITTSGINASITNINAYGVCFGLDVAGNVGKFDNNRITYANGSVGCSGIRMGHTTTGGASVDLRITNTVVECPSCIVKADNSILIEDCGGCSVGPGVDLLQNTHGLHIAPGANQSVLFGNFTASYLADTGVSDGIWIDCNAASAQVYSLEFNQTWSSSSSAGDGVLISNTGGCMGGAGAAFGPRGIHFTDHRSLANGHAGFHFIAGNEITINDSRVCANSLAAQNTYNGILLESGVSKVAIRNSRVGNTCDSLNSQQFSGIFLLGANANVIVTDNDISGNQSAALSTSGATPTGGSLIKANIGIDDASFNVTAADPLVPGVGAYQVIRGTTSPITKITPRYDGQVITLVTFDGTINFNTGGTAGQGPLCNAKSAVPFVPFTATFVAGFACWTLQ